MSALRRRLTMGAIKAVGGRGEGGVHEKPELPGPQTTTHTTSEEQSWPQHLCYAARQNSNNACGRNCNAVGAQLTRISAPLLRRAEGGSPERPERRAR